MNWPIMYCPFCGEYKSLVVEEAIIDDLKFSLCEGCGATGPLKPTEKEAIAAWNRRSPKTEHPYEKEPRKFDMHEITCSQCANAEKPPWDPNSTWRIYCPIWQIEVGSDQHCRFCKWRKTDTL